MMEITSSVHNDINVCTRTFCEYHVTVFDLYHPLKTKIIRHNKAPYVNAE